MAGSLLFTNMDRKSVLKKLNIHIVIQTVLFAVLLAADQISKQSALRDLKGTDGRTVIEGILDLHFVENTGAAFGIFKDSLWIFYVVSSAAFVILILLYARILVRLKHYIKGQRAPQMKTVRCMTALNYILVVLTAGAVGNLIDRILYGYVIDFLYVRFIEFPVFNIADICVTLSVIALIVFFIFFYRDSDDFRLLGKDRNAG